MQEPTHILTGVIVQKSFAWVKPRPLGIALTAAVAFLSHGFLDELARVTYHPADPDFHSVFWITYHSILLVTTIAFLWLFWRSYKWGVTFAALPDLDWIFIHGQQLFHVQIPFYRSPHMHDFLHIIYHKIPPFTWITTQLERLPNNRHQPLACLWEVLLVAVLLLIIRLMSMGKRPAARARSSSGG